MATAAPDGLQQPDGTGAGAEESDKPERRQAKQDRAALDGHDDRRANNQRGDHQNLRRLIINLIKSIAARRQNRG